ncbi:restriction endonuclease, partial [Leptospira borgpetersenii]|uniref:restriction endonuclease n=1 Tax=Leptospira borgpetersenii TaxID=174 RepID=UPI001880CD0E
MPNYDFRTLSPLDFEDLVRDLLQAEEGMRLESFGPGADQGIDFRFASGAGAVIVQAKHYTGAFSTLVAAARE